MAFDEEELDPHGECAAEIARLRGELAKIAHHDAQTKADALAMRSIAQAVVYPDRRPHTD